MRRHVVGTLGRVHETWVAVRREVGHERLEVAAHVGVRVLADHQRRARVRGEHVAEPRRDPRRAHGLIDSLRDLVRPAPPRLDLYLRLVHNPSFADSLGFNQPTSNTRYAQSSKRPARAFRTSRAPRTE